MSLSIYLEAMRPDVVSEQNITHNLALMAAEVKLGDHTLYDVLWRNDATHAWQLVEDLDEALHLLRSDSELYRKFNPTNCWGSYESLIASVDHLLTKCCNNPDAAVRFCP